MKPFLIIVAAILAGCATQTAQVSCNRLAPFTQDFQTGPVIQGQLVNGLYFDATSIKTVKECSK